MPDRDIHFLRHAARLALRGHGGAEPNPLVGCVIVSPSGVVVGWGYHRQCGGPHAEIVALQRAGDNAKGATLYCTLEPCDHTGRTGPCTQAIIKAGIARVVIARRDPNPVAAGGMKTLQAAGIQMEINDRCEAAIMVCDPFAHRVRSGLPWVIAKWAQTIDGKIATRTGESQWISNEASRKLVHHERGRVDAILTGIGTVLKDDPLLTSRSGKPRRIAKRVVVDPRLAIPVNAKLIQTATDVPTIIACDERLLSVMGDSANALRDRGIEILGIPMKGDELSLSTLLRELVIGHDVTNVLTECGSGLLTRLFQQKLVNEAWVFIAPLLLGDQGSHAAVSGITAKRLCDGVAMKLINLRRRRGDVVAHYRVDR